MNEIEKYDDDDGFSNKIHQLIENGWMRSPTIFFFVAFE